MKNAVILESVSNAHRQVLLQGKRIAMVNGFKLYHQIQNFEGKINVPVQTIFNIKNKMVSKGQIIPDRDFWKPTIVEWNLMKKEAAKYDVLLGTRRPELIENNVILFAIAKSDNRYLDDVAKVVLDEVDFWRNTSIDLLSKKNKALEYYNKREEEITKSLSSKDKYISKKKEWYNDKDKYIDRTKLILDKAGLENRSTQITSENVREFKEYMRFRLYADSMARYNKNGLEGENYSEFLQRDEYLLN